MADLMPAFVWGNGGRAMSYEELEQERKVAAAMQAKGIDTSPVQHWTQGMARVAQALAGSIRAGQADAAAEEASQWERGQLESLGMGGAPAQAATAEAPAPAAVPASVGGAPVQPVGISGGRSAFIDTLMPHAMKVSQETGIDPRIIIAQGALESAWGKSAPGNNFFGIKSHGQSGGNTLATTEVVNGRPVRVNDSFRAYPDAGASVADYGNFLKTNRRYQPMLAAKGLDAQIAALGASGYATDPNYASKIKSIALSIPNVGDLPAAGASEIGGQVNQDGFFIPPGGSPQPASPYGALPPSIVTGRPTVPVAENEADVARLEAQQPGANSPFLSPDMAMPGPAPLGNIPMMAGASAIPGQGFTPPQAPPMADVPARGAVQASGNLPLNPPMPVPRPAQTTPAAAPTVAAPVAAKANPFLSVDSSATSNDGGAMAFTLADAAARRGESVPGSVQTVAQAFSNRPTAAGAPDAARTASAPSQGVQAVAQAVQAQGPNGWLALATDRRTSPAVRSVAATMLAKQMEGQKLSQVDLGNSVGFVDSKGNVVRTIAKEKDLAPVTVAPGGALVDPKTGRQIFSSAPKPEAPTVRQIKQPDGSEVAVQYDPATQTWVPLKAPQGGNAVTGNPSNPYALPGKPTEVQSNATGFANRMVEAHNTITQLERIGTDKWEATKGSLPVIGNWASSADKQKFEQAKRNYLTAILRKESGAAISPSEFETAEKQYFPVVGDTAAVIEQKRHARETAIQGIMAAAGNGYKVPETFKPGAKPDTVDTSKPGNFRFNPATGKMEPM